MIFAIIRPIIPTITLNPSTVSDIENSGALIGSVITTLEFIASSSIIELV